MRENWWNMPPIPSYLEPLLKHDGLLGLHQCAWRSCAKVNKHTPTWVQQIAKVNRKHISSNTWATVTTLKMSLQPFARAIFSNTKKGHAIRPDSSVVDSENKTLTLSNSKDNTTPEQDLQLLKTSSREKQADIDRNAAIDTGERETWELTNAGSEFESLVRETLSAKLVQLPRPPSFSPKNTTDGTASAMPATSRDGSGGSSLSRDSCMWSLPSSSLHLPNSLLDDEEILLRPLKVCYSTNKLDITMVVLWLSVWFEACGIVTCG